MTYMREIDEIEGESLDLSRRIINVLAYAKITTVGQARALGYEYLLRLPHMGKKSANQLWTMIADKPNEYTLQTKSDCASYQVLVNGKVILTSELTLEQAVGQIHFLIDRLQRIEASTRKLADECRLFRNGSSQVG